MTCIFCSIANGEIPTNIVYKDEQIVAFNDISPQAPQHKIIIPRQHIATLNEVTAAHGELLSTMIRTATKLAKDLKLSEDGYRLVMNCNNDGGQTVFHIHLHLLGGRQMKWPPG